MRIVTGSARGTKLETLEGTETRPTASVVKEAVFSMIQFEIEGRNVLDLFAGSGQLGLEALSRGAERATFCDANIAATDVIKKNAQKTHLYEKSRVLKSDYKELIRNLSGKEKFDIVFIDPPYAEDLVGDALERIMRAELLSPYALVVCEGERPEPFECEGLTLRKHSRYGRTYITLLENIPDTDESSAD